MKREELNLIRNEITNLLNKIGDSHYDDEINIKGTNIIIEGGRGVGNTTRGLDVAVQTLFKEGYVILKDHWDNGKHEQANKNFVERFKDRMRYEHRNVDVKYKYEDNVWSATLRK